jgi:hypothetical protein
MNDLVGKFPGIYMENKNCDANYNLIFDRQATVNTYGIDYLSHHPKPHENLPKQPELREDEFNDETKIPKPCKPFYITFETLCKYKPEEMELKTFLRRCLKYGKDKYNFGKIDKNDNVLKDYFK